MGLTELAALAACCTMAIAFVLAEIWNKRCEVRSKEVYDEGAVVIISHHVISNEECLVFNMNSVQLSVKVSTWHAVHGHKL
jgi:hypothetical protein